LTDEKNMSPDTSSHAAQMPAQIPALAPAMQASTTEIYLFDADTLRLIDVNQAARHNLGYELKQL